MIYVRRFMTSSKRSRILKDIKTFQGSGPRPYIRQATLCGSQRRQGHTEGMLLVSRGFYPS